MVFGPATKVTWEQGLEILPAISPDGKSVAYASGTAFRMQIYVRPVAGGRSIRLTDDTAVVQSHPRWSPDGTRILFLANGAVWSAPAAGGPARPEVPPGRTGPVLTAAYAPDGKRIAYVVGDSLLLRNEDGTSRGLATFHEPNVCAWSPTGALIACGSGNAMSMKVGENFGNISPSSIVVFRFPDGRPHRVTDSLTLNQNPVWSPDGRWLYFVSNRYGPSDIYGQRLSGSGEPAAAPIRLTTGLGVHTFSLSADGRRLAYAGLAAESIVWSLRLRGPLPVPITARTQVTLGNQNIETANASADGQWLYYDSDLSGNMDVYRMSLATGVPERLTTDPADDFAPRPSPDGREVAFHSWRGGASRDIYVMPLDGGPTQRITNSPEQEAIAAWAPDGNGLTFCEFKAGGGIWIVRRTNGVWGPPVKRLDHGFWPDWSPDGRSLLFTTDLTAGAIYTVPVDSGPAHVVLPASTALGADKALWMPGGTEVMFRGRDAVGRRYTYTIPAGGGTPRKVAVVENREGMTVAGGWGYAQDRIFYSVLEQQSDIAVMEVVP